MLVCNVSLRPSRRAIAAGIVEAGAAADTLGTGNVVFATLVDDPASVNETVDAYLGSIMLEATSAADSWSASIPLTYAADVIEVATAADTSSLVVGDANVKLLMGFDGTNGATSGSGMTDESIAAHGAAAVTGNAQISTAQSKFGGSSLLLDGAGDYITFPDSNDWHLGTGPFTIEGFFRFTATPTNAILVTQWPGGWAFWFLSGQLMLRATGDTNSYSWSPTLNQWYHIAIDRDVSNVARIYVDGVMRAKTIGYTGTLSGSTNVLTIGSLAPGGFPNTYDLNGYVDELRISNVARYGSDAGFTVPVSPYPR